MNRLLLVLLGICLVATLSAAKREDDGRAEIIDNVVEEGADDDDDDDVSNDDDDRPTYDQTNPCSKKKCKIGEECILEKDKAKCVCRAQCPEELDARYKVCSTKNKTFESECHLDREKCLCKKNSPECSTPGKIRLDYYGECQQLKKCPGDEAEQFPRRMRDWLFRVMTDMAKRHEIDEYIPMLEKARHEEDHADAVIWKFCDLDVQPHDRQVTKRELQFVVASFKSMEKCLAPFLNKCDKNKDRKINLIEWGECLELKADAIYSIEDKCIDLQEAKRAKRN